jgi:1-acyl-sn-glycerol-3-phosphate acyltransferase
VRIVAQESGLPILPIVIDGTHVASDLAGFALRMPGARGTLTIGRPIPPDAWKGRIEEVVEEIRTWAAETITAGRLDGSVPPPPDWTATERDAGAAPAGQTALRPDRGQPGD